MKKLIRTQKIDAPIEEVFSFFEKPENLSKITPPNLGFKILTPPPLIMQEGATFAYKITLNLIPMTWRSKIKDYDPPFQFTDEQIQGPYKTWIHTHKFHTEGSSTLIVDEVVYELYGGFIGEIIHSLYVEKSLNKIFNHRKKVIGGHFEKPPNKSLITSFSTKPKGVSYETAI